MKKKIFYLILLLCVVAMPLGVRALDTDYSISGNDISGGGGGGNSTDSTKGYVVTEYTGVRVTLVKANGERIVNKTVNFFDKNFYNSGHGTYYTNYHNKYDLTYRGDNPNLVYNGMTVGGNYSGKTMKDVDGSYVTSDEYGIVSSLNKLKFGK